MCMEKLFIQGKSLQFFLDSQYTQESALKKNTLVISEYVKIIYKYPGIFRYSWRQSVYYTYVHDTCLEVK